MNHKVSRIAKDGTDLIAWIANDKLKRLTKGLALLWYSSLKDGK